MNSKQAIILYAKHWFKEEDLFLDLQKLWEMDYHCCSKNDVFALTVYMGEEIIKSDPRKFVEFVNDTHPDNRWKFNRPNKSELDSHVYGAIVKILSMISVMDAKKLRELFGPIGIPDYSILPRGENITDEAIQRILKNDDK
jgi:hypothetical protein